MNRKVITMFVFGGVFALLAACDDDHAAPDTTAQGDSFMAAVKQMTAEALEESEPADVEAIAANAVDDAEAETVE